MIKEVDIVNKYSIELQEIEYILSSLEQGRIYELSNVKMDGFLATNANKIRTKIKDLIHKIEHSLPSEEEKIGIAVKNINREG